MEETLIKNLITKSKILKSYIIITKLYNNEIGFDYQVVLKSFLMIFIIPNNITRLYENLKEIMNKENAKLILFYKKKYIVEKLDEDVQKLLTNFDNWKEVMLVYNSIPNFYYLLTQEFDFVVPMQKLMEHFSFQTDLIFQGNGEIKRQNDKRDNTNYYFVLLFCLITYQISPKLIDNFEFKMEKSKYENYFFNLMNNYINSIFDYKLEKKLINSIFI